MRAHASIPWTFAVALGCAGPTAPTIGTSPDDLDRTPAADLDAPPEPCEGLPTEMRVLGTIFSPLGHPVGGVEVHGEGAAAPVLTDAVGRYQLMLPGPGAVSLGGRWSWPERSCVGVPPKFTVLGPEGAQIRMNMRDIHLVTAPQCVHDVTWGDDAARWLIAETPRGWERLGHLQPGAVALPCDLDRLVVVGTSDAGVWEAPATSGTWAVPLQPAPTRAIRLQDASGNPLEGVADTPWGAIPTDAKGALDLAWPDAAAPLFARAPGHVPAEPSGSGEVRLQPSRPIEVRCAGHAGDRCEEAPWIEVGGTTFPCRHDGKGRAVCDRPVDAASVVHGGGLAIGVASTEDVAWIDHRGISGSVDLTGTPARCEVWAIRDPGAASRGPKTTVIRAPCSAATSTRIGPLSPGTWTLSVLDAAGRSEQRVDVGAGNVSVTRAAAVPWR
jgi:hypothetical protein